jgi:hypothetical protein
MYYVTRWAPLYNLNRYTDNASMTHEFKLSCDQCTFDVITEVHDEQVVDDPDFLLKWSNQHMILHNKEHGLD